MKTIIITGPSGSGKSYLANKLEKIFKKSIVIKTDSYYRDNFLIRLFSFFQYDIYDRFLSINKYALYSTLRSIYNEKSLITLFYYDFKKRKSFKSKSNINYKDKIPFLIIEGIFSHRLNINYQETINILCEEEEEICYQRRLKRDKKDRGRNSYEVKKKFTRSWYLFYKNVNNYINIKNKIIKNPVDKNSFNELVLNLRKILKEDN